MMILENRLILDLPPRPGYPRNSEGDFLRLKDGRLLFAYSRYHGDSLSDDAPCDIAGLISEDDGEHFAALPEPLISADAHGVRNVMSVSLVRLPKGEAVLFYLCKYEKGTDIFLRRIHENSERNGSCGISLSEPELVCEGRNFSYLVLNNSRVLLTREGRLIVPVAKHDLITEADGYTHGEYRGEAVFIQGDSDARHFHLLSGPHALTPIGHSRTGLQEPCITELPDGRLQALYRTDLMCQYESFSEDSGRTFSPPIPSCFTSPDSPIEIAENPYYNEQENCFRFLAVWNPIPNYNGRIQKDKSWITAGRTPLVISGSMDGLDYEEPLAVEDDPSRGFCYPAVFFTGPDTFLLAYCAGGAADGTCLARLRIRKIRVQ